MTPIRKKFLAVKEASQLLASVDINVRNKILRDLARQLAESIDVILQANAQDLAKMPQTDPRYDRLELSATRIQNIANEVFKVVELPNPIGLILLEKMLPNGLLLKKISVPLGVVAVIYESRPNVTIDVFALCFKAGNACILKGGKEAWATNQALMNVIKSVLSANNLSEEMVFLMPPQRELTFDLLNAQGLVDICIPRGSQDLINYVRDNSKVPVIETGAGIVHLYFDVSGSLHLGKAIINNAKTRRVSVCNALDSVLIHQDRLQDLPQLVELLAAKKVEIYADKMSYHALMNFYPKSLLFQASEEDFGKEFLSYKMSIKTIPSYQEAVKHIMQHTSGHSEAIISEDPIATQYFLNNVDAAVVYVNASTAFTDGGEFGMGSEIGISTQKLHARGPMGLEALTCYKWLVYGNGQVRT